MDGKFNYPVTYTAFQNVIWEGQVKACKLDAPELYSSVNVTPDFRCLIHEKRPMMCVFYRCFIDFASPIHRQFVQKMTNCVYKSEKHENSKIWLNKQSRLVGSKYLRLFQFSKLSPLLIWLIFL